MKKVKALMLAIILILFSFIFLTINGNTYTITYESKNESLFIEIEDENIVQCIDTQSENDVYSFTLKSVSKGKTYYRLLNTSGDNVFLDSVYVHSFGIITANEFMGKSNGSIIIPISTIIWLIYAIYLLITSYKQSVKENMYQYKNIAYLGLIIFLLATLINQITILPNYRGLTASINGILNMSSISILLLPLAFVVSILVIISNISLIKKEGFNFGNTLGIILGLFLCLTSVLPEIMYQLLYTAEWIDIHNQNGLGLYIYNFVESLIYILISYIECILLGTIIMGFKSTKHIPSFDKDAIIILGCQIKKDGSLTKLLKGRVDRAIQFSKMQKEKIGKEVLFVPSGGKGNDELISEAQSMKNYLLEQGVDESKILIEDKSKNTFENIKFSNHIICEKIKDAKIAFATTNYHVLRAGSIATEQSLFIEGIGSKTKSYFWINAFIREFIATLVSEKNKHLAVIAAIVLATIIAIFITYLNNNI